MGVRAEGVEGTLPEEDGVDGALEIGIGAEAGECGDSDCGVCEWTRAWSCIIDWRRRAAFSVSEV